MNKLFIVSMNNDFGVSDQWFEWAESVEEIEEKFAVSNVTEYQIELA